MKVFIVNSPLFRGRQKIDDEDFLPPIGLGYISTFLQLNNIQVTLIDCIANNLSVRRLNSMISNEKPTFLP